MVLLFVAVHPNEVHVFVLHMLLYLADLVAVVGLEVLFDVVGYP